MNQYSDWLKFGTKSHHRPTFFPHLKNGLLFTFKSNRLEAGSKSMWACCNCTNRKGQDEVRSGLIMLYYFFCLPCSCCQKLVQSTTYPCMSLVQDFLVWCTQCGDPSWWPPVRHSEEVMQTEQPFVAKTWKFPYFDKPLAAFLYTWWCHRCDGTMSSRCVLGASEDFQRLQARIVMSQ